MGGGRIHSDMEAVQSCELGTVTHLHRNAQMCKTAGMQAAAGCPHLQLGVTTKTLVQAEVAQLCTSAHAPTQMCRGVATVMV